MNSSDKSSTDDIDVTWPSIPSGILIMGKRQGTKRDNKQLWGRVAMAATLWYSAPHPKPYLLFVASDRHGAYNIPDADIVKAMLVEDFGISADYVIVRQISNCTLLEVRTARVLRRSYGLGHIFAVTHLYHASRTQRYLGEVLPEVSVIPVHPDVLAEIQFPLDQARLWAKLEKVILDSLPGRFDLAREYVVEWFLNMAHTLDPRGRFERLVAKILRPKVY
jgi:uncharacterized SAM-binding protein YcdF (DUF218 family)